MLRLGRFRLLTLVMGVMLGGGGVGCDGLGDLPLGDIPPTLSDQTCYTDDDCVANACCGLGTAVTHADEGPTCSGPCNSGCPEGSIDCGRCIPTCREARCAAACQ